MEEEDDPDSLFAGMDFVVPLSPLPDLPSPSRPLDPLDFSESPSISNQDQASLTPEPASELPFNGRTSSPISVGSEFDQDLVGSLGKPRRPADLKPHLTIESIMAAYDKVESRSSVSKPSVDPSKPGVRRKKRNLKIGYGRGGEDCEEPSQNKPSASEPAATNGVGLQVSVNNVIDEEVESTGSKSDAGIAEGSNGLTGFSGTTQSSASERLENSIEDPGTSDPGTEKVQGLSVGSLAEAVGPEERIAEASSRSEEEASAKKALEGFSLDDRLVIEDAGAESGVSVASTYDHRKENADSENICDMPELGIEVPSGLPIGERLEFIKNAAGKIIQRIQERVAAMSKVKKLAAQMRRQAADTVSSTSAKFKEVEAELEAACEREDFEKAESLSETLAVAEKARDASLESFRAAELDFDKAASEMQELIQMQVKIEAEGVLMLERLRQDASDAADLVRKDAEEKRQKEIEAVIIEEEAVKLKKKKLVLELRVVEEAKSELHKVIDASIQTELQEKGLLMNTRQVLLEELDNLLAAVRAKEALIADHDKAINDIEEKVSKTTAGFENERAGLEIDFENLTSGLERLEKDSEDLNTRKIRIEASISQAQEEEKKLQEFSNAAEIEAQKLQDALQIRKCVSLAALSSKEKRAALALEEKEAEEVCQRLRSEAASLRTSLQDLASERLKLHKESLSASHRLSLMEKRGPEIESEKKVAAAARNFKEAGRLAMEAKQLQAEKETVSSDLNRITVELQKLDQELAVQMKDLSDVDNQVLQKEREAALARCERLRLLSLATRDERDAAAELDDFEEAESLHLEAEAADKEADELQKQYGLEDRVYLRSSSTAPKLCSVTINSELELHSTDETRGL